MSLKLTGSASKSKQTTKGTTSTTTTPIVPEWGASLVQGAAGQVASLLGRDARQYVAPAHALQDQAAAGAAALGAGFGSAAAGVPRRLGDMDWLSPTMNAATPFASGGKAYDYVSRYLNPYLREVVDASASDFDAHAGQVRAQQALELAGAGAFGGSGAALARSMTEGELARGRASTLSGLRSRAYEQALGAAAGDADRATQARMGNAQLALQDRAQKAGFGFQAMDQLAAADANQRANIAAQMQAGTTYRDMDQQRRRAEIENTQQIIAMLNGLPIQLFTGEQRNHQEEGVVKQKGFNVGFEASHSFAKAAV